MTHPSDYPEEYIDGCIDFFYLPFHINKHVLIPRLETESLVRAALDLVRTNSISTLIDVGTGSGIIPISIAKNSGIQHIHAVDISPTALKVTETNAASHDITMTLHHEHLLDGFLHTDRPLSRNILITANLPYIRHGDTIGPGVEHEPEKALYGGSETGFELYQEFFMQLQLFIKKYDTAVIRVIVEIGHDQKEIAHEFLTTQGIPHRFLWDLRAIDRIIIIEYTGSSRLPI